MDSSGVLKFESFLHGRLEPGSWAPFSVEFGVKTDPAGSPEAEV